MYMGVILMTERILQHKKRAPHVYGGDPRGISIKSVIAGCSPCIWG